MMRIGTVLALVASLGGGVTASQLPELTQQYRQRLHGALQELGQVVAEFEADAARHEMERDEALALYENGDDLFLQDRSLSMRRTIDRLEHLDRQSTRLAELPLALRPLAVFTDPDATVLKGAMSDFEPAVPLTVHGMVWTVSGLLAGFGLYKVLAFPFRRRRGSPAAQRA